MTYLLFYGAYVAIGLAVAKLAVRSRHHVHHHETVWQWYWLNAGGWPIVLFALYRVWLEDLKRRMLRRPPRWYDRLFWW